jgi:hypothetical protein
MQLGAGVLEGVVHFWNKLLVLHAVSQVLVERPEHEPSAAALNGSAEIACLVWQQE